MKITAKSAILSAAISGLFLGATATTLASTLTSCKSDNASSASNANAVLEKHACAGLNTCTGKGADGKNTCAGKGSCATVKHDCAGKNQCKMQGGCGGKAGKNDCSGKGGCASPVKAEHKK